MHIARFVRVKARRALSLAALCGSTALGCGGNAYTEPDGTQGTSTPVGGAGSRCSSCAGDASEPATPAPALLDDETQWFVSSPNAAFESEVATTPGDNGGKDKVLRLAFGKLETTASVSTSLHFDAIGAATTLRFAAQARAPLKLEVSVARDTAFGSYFAAREAGQPWPSTTVTLGTPDAEWHDHVARLADMMPPDSSEVKPLGNLVIGFTLLQQEGATEVLLDKIRFE